MGTIWSWELKRGGGTLFQRAATYFGFGLIKIYLIGPIASVFENIKKCYSISPLPSSQLLGNATITTKNWKICNRLPWSVAQCKLTSLSFLPFPWENSKEIVDAANVDASICIIIHVLILTWNGVDALSKRQIFMTMCWSLTVGLNSIDECTRTHVAQPWQQHHLWFILQYFCLDLLLSLVSLFDNLYGKL